MKAYTNKKTFTDDMKIAEDIAKCKAVCEHCGHPMTMAKVDRVICSWCGYFVYKNEKAKFKYKMKEMMLNAKQIKY